MITLTLTEIATAVDGQILNNGDASLSIDSVCTDTRNINRGCLFIALQGDNFDAHQFVDEAENAGATALITHKTVTTTLPTILVDDTRLALGTLSAFVKTKISHLKCAAITGSNGKTTTKELLSAILHQFCSKPEAVLATAGNFNNDIGLPLTLLRLTEQTEFAVVELGANHLGEIAYTSNLAKPDVALINNVMPAHLEGFGSIEGIAKAKGEIWTSLTEQGTGVVNLDAKFSEQFISEINKQQSHLFTFSQHNKDATLFASDIQYDEMGYATFILNYQPKNASKHCLQVSLNIAGKHNVSNALAATSMAIVLGCDLETIVLGLAQVKEVAGRVNSNKINTNLTLIDDSYNANSASLVAAIDLLEQHKGEKTLIFADMGELGKYSEQEHRRVGEYAAKKGINHLLTVGKLTEFSHCAFNEFNAPLQKNNESALHFADKNALKQYLKTYLQGSTEHKITILVKGSRSAKMEEIVAYIKQPQIG